MIPTSDPSPPGETDADITEKLRRAAPFMRATGNAGIVGQHANTCEEAAAEIESLRLQKAGLESLLVDAQEEIAAKEQEIILLSASLRKCEAALKTKPGWQPIETAPKDGTRILVVWLGQVEIATWADDVPHPSWQEWPDGDFDTGGEVTLWMPLPDPPSR